MNAIEEEEDNHFIMTASRTIVASDNEVSNGFVKDGKMLPYVFEATESGSRKRSSKILPVCGVCGKRFVCVTTMKRHLVTHTGEKPFSCKVCGKQYTQKGNLRVHERTHRNDRPFECDICHQKFYRKEPMQKHQWRQHGVVHYKARPHPAGINTTGPPTTPLINNGEEKVLYNSIVDRIKFGSFETMSESSRHFDGSPSDFNNPEDLSRKDNKRPFEEQEEEEEGEEESVPLSRRPMSPSPMANTRLLTTLPITTALPITPIPHPATVNTNLHQEEEEEEDTSSGRPIKLKKMLAHAYQKEVEEEQKQQHEEEEHRENQNVECQCKSCGHVFRVVDPYNFRCDNCRAKYTSLPTHMIADPLQCIGCRRVFAHKPALKAHQMTAEEEGVERPFRCCKCGYGFRQKAHLQKHQWRIHRRKLEPDPSVKEAEAILAAVHRPSATTITLQDIIDRGVERSLSIEKKATQKVISVSNNNNNNNQPLDLSPTKPTPRLSDLMASLPPLPSSSVLASSLPLIQQRQAKILLNPLNIMDNKETSFSKTSRWLAQSDLTRAPPPDFDNDSLTNNDDSIIVTNDCSIKDRDRPDAVTVATSMLQTLRNVHDVRTV